MSDISKIFNYFMLFNIEATPCVIRIGGEISYVC